MGDLKPGIIVQLPELKPSSQYYKALQSLRILGLLERYSAQTGMAVITHGGARFRVDTQHLRNLQLRIGSLYQFIGELSPDPDFPSEARVGRNVDGLDLDLYEKALQIRRQFEQKYLKDKDDLADRLIQSERTVALQQQEGDLKTSTLSSQPAHREH